MPTRPKCTTVQRGLASIQDVISVWESRNDAALTHGLIGDASGNKPLARDEVKKIAVVRLNVSLFEARKPITPDQTFTVDNPMDEKKEEEMRVIGWIEKGKVGFVIGDEEAKAFFTSLGVVGDVNVFDVGEMEKRKAEAEELEVREREKRNKKKDSRRRQKERKAKEKAEVTGEAGGFETAGDAGVVDAEVGDMLG